MTPALAPGAQADVDSALLYVSNGAGSVSVFRYSQRTFLLQIAGLRAPKGECVDASGNVFIAESGVGKIREYARGGTKPIELLDDRGYQPYSCSVDPTTGNLAVANYHTSSGGDGGIAIYRHARGHPKLYGPIKGVVTPIAVGYNDKGDLLIASLFMYSGRGYATFALLPKGRQSFVFPKLSGLSGSSLEDATSVQWDGKYWAVADYGQMLRYSIADNGDSKFEGRIALAGMGAQQGQFWIFRSASGSQIVGADSASNTAYYWQYPAGGSPIASIASHLKHPYGITVSR